MDNYQENHLKQKNNKKQNSFKGHDPGESKINYGLTTGSIATATSLAALKKIINPRADTDFIRIKTPFNELDVKIENCEILGGNKAEAFGIKYPYNDPDVTVNLKIVSSVELMDSNNDNFDKVIIGGGIGVGTITKPGLQIQVGNPAINPIPLAMIKKNLEKFVPDGKIANVIISVPDGEKIAKQTMNPKLGIIGGISILGTTGIARSMSTKAYKDSLLCQFNIAIALISDGIYNKDSLVFVPGNIGENLALENLDVDGKRVEKDQIVQMGNFPGFMFEEAKKRGIDKLTLFGHIGKIVKLAGGIYNTKHSIADGRREIIASHAALCGANKEIIKAIFNSKATEDMVNILKKEGMDIEVMDSISLAIKERCLERFKIHLDVIIVDMKANQLNSKS
jgi:cobalt-precorrin-5B (C1)-methyltransferase